MAQSDRKPWSPEEDEAIRNLVEEFGTKKWTFLAQLLSERYGISDRTGKQCRERWHNHLESGIVKKAWTKNEEKKLFECHQIYGNKWSEIAKYLPGRTDNSIKNQFYSTIRRNLRKLNRQRPQGEKLTGSVQMLLKNEEIAKLLVVHPSLNKENAKSPSQKNISQKPQKSPKRATKGKKSKKSPKAAANSQKSHPIPQLTVSPAEEGQKLTEKDRPAPIVCPSPTKTPEIVPNNPCTFESTSPSKLIAAITPTPTGFLRKSPINSRFFRFPEDATTASNWDTYMSSSLGDHGLPSLGYQFSDSLLSCKSTDSLRSSIKYDRFKIPDPSPQARDYLLPPYSPADSFQHYFSPRNI
ncbi:unnamed protein product [Blepharisma stoltei]|uniref:Uncharacterized protein n=1 Tax=Blepharisma stoltei TaxID=1481888 RepID=A0AAU9J7S4_9CILI|nr:unnamed protein product [Blepharisma stoltei]